MTGITRRALLAGLVKQPTKPAVAFHYAAHFSAREVAWYSSFEILVTGGILTPEHSALLRGGGSRLVAYEWSSAFYPGDWVSAAESWQKRMRPEWLLTRVPVTGGAAENGKPAQWYDFANPDLVAARADYLAARLAQAGYDGFFFDTLGWEQLPPPVQAAFLARHPGVDYNASQGEFLKALRQRLPAGKLIFTNQGFRHAESFLPHADLDLTESYFTYVSGTETKFRPWHDPAKPWDSIRTPMVELVGAAERKFPHVRFVHVNYAHRTSPRAAMYSYAAAKLFGHESYLIVPTNAQAEEHAVYQSSLGRPLTASFEENAAAGAAWRRFEGGTVAILSGPKPFAIPGTALVLPTPGLGYLFPSGD